MSLSGGASSPASPAGSATQPRDARTLRVALGQCSSAGPKEENQDFLGARVPSGRELLLKGIAVAVADGISSSSVGRIAAESAIKSFLTDYYATPDSWSVKTAGHCVVAAANTWLHAQTRRNHLHEDFDRGFVCTFSALILKAGHAHVFHVGDSRIYRIRAGHCERLTSDHRVALASSETYLNRALGLAVGVEVEYRSVDVAADDLFVLTTDGVHDHVAPNVLASVVAAESDLDRAASRLVAQALANGSDDNATVQILRIESLPSPDAGSALELGDTLPPAPLPRVPSEFEGYRVLREIHASNRSHIYLAQCLENGAKVALKVPSLDMRDDPAYLRRFAMEEWIARRVQSPHVLKAAPSTGPRAHLYVVTELFEGQTLRQWMLDHRQRDLETVRHIVEQIAKGLRGFHRREMLHQDLRPENVMIDADGTVKIIDFGAVRVAGVIEAAPNLRDEPMLGTLQYAAPEYFLGWAGTEQSDQFSLGVIAYELLTGVLPYGADVSRSRTPKDAARLRYRPADTPAHPVPAWIDAALRRAVNPDPRKRYEALSEFVTDLRLPNPDYARDAMPFAERDPVRFWQLVSAALAVALIASLIVHAFRAV